MAFENAYVSIQGVCLDLYSAGADAASGEAVGAEDEFAIVPFGANRLGGQRGHGEVRVDPAIHGFKTKVGRQAGHEGELHGAIDGPELRVLTGILPEADLHWAIDGMDQRRTSAHVF